MVSHCNHPTPAPCSPAQGVWKRERADTPPVAIGRVRTRGQLVELKNGETFNGHLVACDNFMNLTIKEVYQTSAVSV